MAPLYPLTPAFQRWLRPLAGWLARIGVTPNQVTLTALAVSVASGALLMAFPAGQAVLLLLPFVMFVRLALNAIDGLLAREHQMQTRFGGFLNELCDVVSDCALTLPFVLVLPQAAAWVVLLTVFAVLGESAGVAVQALGGSRRYDGPMGKSDRACLFGLIALLLGMGVAPGLWCVMLVAAGCGLSVLTLFRRISRGSREIDAIHNTQGETGA